MTQPTSIYCPACARHVGMSSWSCVMRAVPVVAGEKVVGHVSVLRHGACRSCTAIPVKV